MSAYWLDEAGTGVGWQLQGRYWRLAMLVGDRDLGRVRPEDHVDWFDFEPLLRVLQVKDEEVRAQRARVPVDGFNRYGEVFFYRYRLLPEATSVRQVVALATAFGHAAQEWTLGAV